MSTLTVKDVKLKKIALTTKIRQLIEEFEDTTAVDVTGIYVNRTNVEEHGAFLPYTILGDIQITTNI